MEFITFVKRENVSKAEEALRKDFDLAAKQSITIRDAKALEIEANGSFFYITGSDDGIERCKKLLKDFVEKIGDEKKEQAKKKIIEEQDSAAAGIGGIFG